MPNAKKEGALPEKGKIDVVLGEAYGLKDISPQPDALAGHVDVVDPRLGRLGDDAQMEEVGVGMVLCDPARPPHNGWQRAVGAGRESLRGARYQR